MMGTTLREKPSTSVDLPLSNECKRVLAAEEAERLGRKQIGAEQLPLGLRREVNCFAAQLLKERGVQLNVLREQLAQSAHESAASVPATPASVPLSSRNLTQAATDGLLESIKTTATSEGHTAALKAVLDDMRLHLLARLNQMEAMLIGEFRQSTSRMESGQLPAQPAHNDYRKGIEEQNPDGDQPAQEQEPSGQGDNDITNHP